jgi:hypothetical protein
MRPKKYPLDPLARVRAMKVDDAARALAESTRLREEAERKRAEAERRVIAAEDAARVVRDAERDALDRGELTVADLMRGDAWGFRVREEQAELERRAADSLEREGAAKDGEDGARVVVAERKADAEIVERDRSRWADGERRRAEAKDEEAAADAWRPKKT